ncbi:hypothetical protein HXX76_000933 [Chlamydomonas incerta]|uniref:Ion transport domain-containing protein n=1 Tax=Chlamydomonas incerta TaxID=51695 RepID=A0A836B357_CHLIN|nr:hypothetical protein HXX76_000933 [Chlamydomonas incerta]|eukprot:KAG2446346.1 hypothetical protein HXX76_000933 [Chlamydomonas incerta]
MASSGVESSRAATAQPLKVFLHPSLRSLRTRHGIWTRRLAPLGVQLTQGQQPEQGTFLAVVDVEGGAAGGSSGPSGDDSYCRLDAHSAGAAQLLEQLRRGAAAAATAETAAAVATAADKFGTAGAAVAAGATLSTRERATAAATALGTGDGSRKRPAVQGAGQVGSGAAASNSLGSSSHSTARSQRSSGSASSRASLDSASLASLAAAAAAAADKAVAATANWERAPATAGVAAVARGAGGGRSGCVPPHVLRLVSDRWLVACCEAGALLDPAPYNVLQAPARLAVAAAAAHLRTPDQPPHAGSALEVMTGGSAGGPGGSAGGPGGRREGEPRARKRLHWQDESAAQAPEADRNRDAGAGAVAGEAVRAEPAATARAAAGDASARPAALRAWMPPRLLATSMARASATTHATWSGGGVSADAGATGAAAAAAAAPEAHCFCSTAAVVVGHEPTPLAWWDPAASAPEPAAVATAAPAAQDLGPPPPASAVEGGTAGGGTAAAGEAAGAVPRVRPPGLGPGHDGAASGGRGVGGWEAVAVPVAGGAWVPLPDHLGRPRAVAPAALQPPRWLPLPLPLPLPRGHAAAAGSAGPAAARGQAAEAAAGGSSSVPACGLLQPPAPDLLLPRVRVVSYNVLGNTACMASRFAAAMPREHTALEFRGPRLLQELRGYDADVICLQEVDVSVFRLWLQPWAARHGYAITYLPRGASKPLGPMDPAPRHDPSYSPFSTAGGRGSRSGGRGAAGSSISGVQGELDGIALLVRGPRLRLLSVQCEELAARRPGGSSGGGGGSSSGGFWSLLGHRGVGAILALVEVVDGGSDAGWAAGGVGKRGINGGSSGGDKAVPGRVFAVGTTHLWWDPRLPHVKAAQAALLCEAAADFLRRAVPAAAAGGPRDLMLQPQDVPLVLAGDLNSRWAVFDPPPLDLGLTAASARPSRSSRSRGARPPPGAAVASAHALGAAGGSGGGGGGQGGDSGGGPQGLRRPSGRCLVSGVYELLAGGRLGEDHPHHPASPELLAAAVPGDVRLHTSGLRLASAHAVADGREPPATNNSSNFIGCLDYVWLSRGGHWAVSGTLALPYTYGPDPQQDGLVGAVRAASRRAAASLQPGDGRDRRRGGAGGAVGAVVGGGLDTHTDDEQEGSGALGSGAVGPGAEVTPGAQGLQGPGVATAAAGAQAQVATVAAHAASAATCPVMPNATFPSDHWAVGAELVLLGGNDVKVTVDAGWVFDTSKKDFSQLRLWDECEHFTLPRQPLPEQITRSPTYTFTAVNDHWTANKADYLQVSFFQPCAVYLLLVNIGRVPLWVRAGFTKLPESKFSLAVKWKLSPHIVLLAMMSQKLAACRGARLHLWEYKEVCVPGQVYNFGGSEGVQGLEDYTYLFLWRPLTHEEVAQLEAAGGAGAVSRQLGEKAWDADGADGPDAAAADATAAGRAANARRRAKHLEKIVQAVLDDDIESLQRSCEAYGKVMARIAKAVTALQQQQQDGAGGAASGAGGGPGSAAALPAALLRPSFLTLSGRPLTSIAADLNVQPRLVLYLVSQGAELDTKALRFLLTNSKALPTGGYRDVRHLMMAYLLHQRNPIACAMVFAQILDEQAALFSGKKREYTTLSRRLRLCAVAMVELLQKLNVQPGEEAGTSGGGGGGGGGATGAGEGGAEAAGGGGGGPQATLADVLAPRGVTCSLNDYSALQVAYETKDLDFMSASVVQTYLQDRWLGADYIANALQDKGTNIHYGDHHLVLRVLESAGFVGGLGRKVARHLSYLMHLMLLASRPFFDSPRGRWVFRLMCEAFLLYVFHAVQLMRDQTHISWQHPVLVLYVASMVVDEVQEVMHQYRGRLGVYFQDGFNVVEGLAMLLLIGSGACKAAMLAIGSDNPHWGQLLTAKDFMYNTASIFMWARLLQYIIPLYDGVGSLLMVISKMIIEVFKFAVPGTILMMGVAFTMFATFRDRDVPVMDSFPNVLLLLFRTFLGETMFDVLDAEYSTLYNVYGNIIVLLYALTATVVLANLLIALISYHFQPEKVESQSRFQMAEILAHYEAMVEGQLVGAPFSLPQLLLVNLLPSGWRRMAPANTIHRFAIMPLDGNPVSSESRDSKLYPTGSREVPYLIFLLTAYPLVIASALGLGAVMAPYCMLFFALHGYRRWVPPEDPKPPPPPPAAAAATAKGGRQLGASTKVAPEPVLPGGGAGAAGAGPGGEAAKQGPQHTSVGLLGGIGAMSMVEMAADAAAALGGAAVSAVTAGLEIPEDLGGGEAGPVHGPGSSPDGPNLYPAWNTKQRVRALGTLLLRIVMYIVTRPLWLALGAFVLLVGLGVVVLITWLGVYQWAGRLAYTSFCVAHGWIHGWFGGGEIMLGGDVANTANNNTADNNTNNTNNTGQRQSQQQPGSGGGGGGGPAAAGAARRTTWVRAYQASLQNGGQVLTKQEVAGAMLRAGFTAEEVAAADVGAWGWGGADGAGGRGGPGGHRSKRHKSAKQRKSVGARSQRAVAVLDDEDGGALGRRQGKGNSSSSDSDGSSSDANEAEKGRRYTAAGAGVLQQLQQQHRSSLAGAAGPVAAATAAPQDAAGSAAAAAAAPMLRGLLQRLQAMEAEVRGTLESVAGVAAATPPPASNRNLTFRETH